ncbi:dTDP-4-dehydrorhamnose 3,5-epimerase [Halorubrum sp. BV1]|uniref:dTDP-4-dehydrorhamnose 3,5-epimerase n=1 Tax=Halorubrum sp. BV1 TaxID=1498500 RepID=UPI0006790F35|nr:dTDP-4-dehydrorhamnose 3,5-epimerase [Halorubrum sp. BV1]
MPFYFERQEIPDVVLVETDVFSDRRGSLFEMYNRPLFEDAGIDGEFHLELVSRSAQNVLRGLHIQRPPYAQAKLVRCVSGEIFDVAVDLRASSDTFGDHVSVRLSEDNDDALYIPPGFAHGFLALDESTVLYKLDDEYAPDHEGGVRWNDPRLAIDWPLDGEPVLSDDDRELPTLNELESAGDLL